MKLKIASIENRFTNINSELKWGVLHHMYLRSLHGVYEVRETWKVRELRNGLGKVREFDKMARENF